MIRVNRSAHKNSFEAPIFHRSCLSSKVFTPQVFMKGEWMTSGSCTYRYTRTAPIVVVFSSCEIALLTKYLRSYAPIGLRALSEKPNVHLQPRNFHLCETQPVSHPDSIITFSHSEYVHFNEHAAIIHYALMKTSVHVL